MELTHRTWGVCSVTALTQGLAQGDMETSPTSTQTSPGPELMCTSLGTELSNESINKHY